MKRPNIIDATAPKAFPDRSEKETAPSVNAALVSGAEVGAEVEVDPVSHVASPAIISMEVVVNSPTDGTLPKLVTMTLFPWTANGSCTYCIGDA